MTDELMEGQKWRQLNLYTVVGLLMDEHGIKATADHSGGGTTCVYVWPTFEDSNGEYRHTCLGGPGWWAKVDGVMTPVASSGEFYIGPDDDGEVEPTQFPIDGDEQLAAQMIADFVKGAR